MTSSLSIIVSGKEVNSQRRYKASPARQRTWLETCHWLMNEVMYMIWYQHDDSLQPLPVESWKIIRNEDWEGWRFHSSVATKGQGYLWVNNEDLALRYANLKVADFISVSIAKTGIEWVAIRRKHCFYILEMWKTRKRVCN